MINDLEGIIVSNASIKAGTKVGTSDILIEVKNSKNYDAYVLIDNYNGRYSGKNKLVIGSDFYSPFHYGDKFSLSNSISSGENLKDFLTSYTLPLHKSGLKAKIEYSRTSYHLIKEYKNLDAHGNSKNILFNLTYAYLRQRYRNLNFFLTVKKSSLKDEIGIESFINKKQTHTSKIGLNYSKLNNSIFGIAYNLQSNIYFTVGHLKFDDQTQKNIDKEGANTSGKYAKVNFSYSSLFQLKENLSLEVKFNNQHSLKNKNLDGSEDFLVGGINAVKIYPSSELSAENGYVFNTELKYNIFRNTQVSNSIGVFYDRGKAYAENSVNRNSRTLQDIGVGYYLTYKDFFTKLQIVWKINNERISSEPDNNSKLLFTSGLTF